MDANPMQGNESKTNPGLISAHGRAPFSKQNPIVLASGGVTLSGPVTGMEKAELQPTEGRSAKINTA